MSRFKGKNGACTCGDGVCGMDCNLYRLNSGTPSNHDNLRAMSAPALAHFIMRTTDCPCVARETGCCRSDISCQKAWLDWLNREAEK